MSADGVDLFSSGSAQVDAATILGELFGRVIVGGEIPRASILQGFTYLVSVLCELAARVLLGAVLGVRVVLPDAHPPGGSGPSVGGRLLCWAK